MINKISYLVIKVLFFTITVRGVSPACVLSSQGVETQHFSCQQKTVTDPVSSHFAIKINANLSQIFENTTLQAFFFKIFLLTSAFCHLG